MARRWLVPTLIVSLFSTAPAFAQAPLAWTFRPGDAFDVEHRILQNTALETKNKPFQQKSDWALRTRWLVKDLDKDAAQLSVTVSALTTKVMTGDGKLAAPSKDDELWRGAEFQLTVDPSGRLRELKGHDELLKKLAGDNVQRLKVLTALKPPESFQTMFQAVLGPLPERDGKSGQPWRHTATDVMSIFGSFVHVTEFTHREQKEGMHVIATTTKTTYKAPRYALENDVFRVVSGDVTADEGKGELLFDAAKGRMRQVRNTMSVRGELTIETLTGKQRVTFSSTTEARIDVR